MAHIRVPFQALPACLLLALVVVTAASCGGGADGNITTMMEKTPLQATSLSYSDVREMSDDQELHTLLDDWKARNEVDLAFFGIDADMVEHFMLFVDANGNESIIVTGDFRLEDIREGLRDRGFREKDFKLVEVWESDDDVYWVAIPESDCLVMGPKETVKDSIRTIEGAPSLLDDPDAQDIIDRLPGGFLVGYADAGNQTAHAGLIAAGQSFAKKSGTMLDAGLIFKFDEPESAADALEALHEEVDEDDDRVEANQDGRYIVVEAEVGIEEKLRQSARNATDRARTVYARSDW